MNRVYSAVAIKGMRARAPQPKRRVRRLSNIVWVLWSASEASAPACPSIPLATCAKYEHPQTAHLETQSLQYNMPRKQCEFSGTKHEEEQTTCFHRNTMTTQRITNSRCCSITSPSQKDVLLVTFLNALTPSQGHAGMRVYSLRSASAVNARN